MLTKVQLVCAAKGLILQLLHGNIGLNLYVIEGTLKHVYIKIVDHD